MSSPTPSEPVDARLPGLACGLRLVDAPAAVRRLLAERWLLTVLGPARQPVYALRFRPPSTLPAAPARPRALRRPPRVRLRFRDDPQGRGDLLVTPGGRLRFVPGEPGATVELAPTRASSAVVEALVEAALGHALALVGGCILHAAGLALGGRRVLVLGPAGAGKSTLAAAALAGGGRVVSDDSLVVALDARGRPEARALRRDLWLRPESLPVLPPPLRELCRRHRRDAESRWRLPRQALPSGFLDRLRPDCLLLMRRDRRLRSMRVRPVAQAQALAGLLEATSALFLVERRFARERTLLLRLLTGLAERLPAAEGRLGRALLDRPRGTLSRLIERLPGP